jgi:hypothetical protein
MDSVFYPRMDTHYIIYNAVLILFLFWILKDFPWIICGMVPLFLWGLHRFRYTIREGKLIVTRPPCWVTFQTDEIIQVKSVYFPLVAIFEFGGFDYYCTSPDLLEIYIKGNLHDAFLVKISPADKEGFLQALMKADSGLKKTREGILLRENYVEDGNIEWPEF